MSKDSNIISHTLLSVLVVGISGCQKSLTAPNSSSFQQPEAVALSASNHHSTQESGFGIQSYSRYRRRSYSRSYGYGGGGGSSWGGNSKQSYWKSVDRNTTYYPAYNSETRKRYVPMGESGMYYKHKPNSGFGAVIQTAKQFSKSPAVKWAGRANLLYNVAYGTNEVGRVIDKRWEELNDAEWNATVAKSNAHMAKLRSQTYSRSCRLPRKNWGSCRYR